MAAKGAKYPKKRVVAKLVTENRQPCVFCQQDEDDEVVYGRLYSLGDIQCHYFCVLLSCCLVQKGKDSEGLFGFLYKDILAEVERSKKHKCSYCGRGGASLGCCVSACRKQFHLPCGRRKNVVSLFYGTYKSFCELHAPKQKISDSVMANAKARMKRDKLMKAGKLPVSNGKEDKQTEEDAAMVCVICYEEVQGYPTTQTFWPPCCGRDAWLHRSCLQRMALSAGMHYMKCPLCNDKETFFEAVTEQGYYLPDRDALWELEQNAYAEMYARDATCAALDCKCPFGRAHDELGIWDIKLCLLCGSWGMHAHCSGGERPVCGSCRPAAEDIDQLEPRLAAVIMAEQAREQRGARSGPVMPPRMSLRRTKNRTQPHSSSSSQNLSTQERTRIKTEALPINENMDSNQKPPRPKLLTPNLKDLETKLLSPIKMLEQSYLEKGGGSDVVVTNDVIEKIRLKFSKPKPLSAKKKIVNEILDDLFNSVFKETLKSKDPVKEWNSPKKSFDLTVKMSEESKENSEPISNTNMIETYVPKLNETVVESSLPRQLVLVASCDSAIEEIPEILDDNKREKENQENINMTSTDEGKNNVIIEETDDKDKHLSDVNVQNTDLNVNDKYAVLNENDKNTDLFVNDNNTDLNINDKTGFNDTRAEELDTSRSDDESSNSTFQLPPEFIAESDDSLPIFDTPKKLKTVNIKQDSSMEISENDEMVNIDVVQVGSGREKEFIESLALKNTTKNKMCVFKFSPTNKDVLENCDVDLDVESFKEQYLHEVDREYKPSNNINDEKIEFDSVSDSGIDVSNRKRKLEMKDVVRKKRKKTKLRIKIKNCNPVELKEKRVKKLKKIKDLKNIAKGKQATVKIKLKEGKRKTKITKKKKVKGYKQYVLQYSPIQSDKVIVKPDVEISPMKRKYTKTEKSVDRLVQTSIQSFFKAV